MIIRSSRPVRYVRGTLMFICSVRCAVGTFLRAAQNAVLLVRFVAICVFAVVHLLGTFPPFIISAHFRFTC